MADARGRDPPDLSGPDLGPTSWITRGLPSSGTTAACIIFVMASFLPGSARDHQAAGRHLGEKPQQYRAGAARTGCRRRPRLRAAPLVVAADDLAGSVEDEERIGRTQPQIRSPDRAHYHPDPARARLRPDGVHRVRDGLPVEPPPAGPKGGAVAREGTFREMRDSAPAARAARIRLRTWSRLAAISWLTGIWQVATFRRDGAAVADGRVSQVYEPSRVGIAARQLAGAGTQPWPCASFVVASADASVWYRLRHSS